MKQSLRAKRMAKHHRRLNKTPKLNLVSLMDIFTILVFFLLVNSGDVEVLQVDKSINLPTSLSDRVPENNLLLTLNATEIIVGGKHVGKISELNAIDMENFLPLLNELNRIAQQSGPLLDQAQASGRAITIMADQKISYDILKKIMSTCAAAHYRNISLAVTQKEGVVKAGGN